MDNVVEIRIVHSDGLRKNGVEKFFTEPTYTDALQELERYINTNDLATEDIQEIHLQFNS